MKCPDCGYEYLPGDVECLACGVDIASAIQNKEKERIRSLEALKRKEQYDIELKKELGLIPEDEQTEKPVSKGTTLQETFMKKPTCPKCGAPRHPESPECLRCGVIFDKLKTDNGGAAPKEKKEPAQELKKAPVEDIPDLIMDDITESVEIDENALEIDPVSVSEDSPESGPAIDSVGTGTDIQSEDIEHVELVMEDDKLNAPDEDKKKQYLDEAAALLQTEPLNEETESVQRKKPVPRPTMISTDSTLRMYQKKIKQNVQKIIGQSAEETTKAIETSSSWVRDNKKIVAGIIAVLVLAIASPFIHSAYKSFSAERQKRERIEKMKDTQLYFLTHKNEIDTSVRQIINEKKFSQAEEEISKYDIPALSSEISPLKKYLKEVKTVESIEKIPESDIEKKHQAYSELVKLNPNNPTYSTQRDLYRQKYADNLYSEAAALKSSAKGKKDISTVKEAIALINKAVSLLPESRKYQDLKNDLIEMKLLFLEGNDKITMAVKDNGMGGKLYSNQRKITIWLQNISQEVVYINVQYIYMIGRDNIKYTYNDMGLKFKTSLAPGEQTMGEIYYKTRTSPSKIVFNHLVCGEISRSFQ